VRRHHEAAVAGFDPCSAPHSMIDGGHNLMDIFTEEEG
jgi:hypothetical protein